MADKIVLQPAYVLHSMPFRNTSALVDFFCLDYGRIRAVARGVRRPRSRSRSLLQAFQPLLVSLSGRGELMTLSGLESATAALHLSGSRLFSGLYVNELLVRLLQNHEAHPDLFRVYQQVLLRLHGDSDLQAALRQFEMSLLTELGYGFDLEYDCSHGSKIEAQNDYLFHPEQGFELLPHVPEPRPYNVFSGLDLLRLRQLDLSREETARSAKRLLRLALQPHLGSRPLLSRELFKRLSPSEGAD